MIMQAIKLAHKFIATHPDDPASTALAALAVALANESPFTVTDLYQLDHERFSLAMKIIEEWRMDRYFTSKGRLIDAAVWRQAHS